MEVQALDHTYNDLPIVRGDRFSRHRLCNAEVMQQANLDLTRTLGLKKEVYYDSQYRLELNQAPGRTGGQSQWFRSRHPLLGLGRPGSAPATTQTPSLSNQRTPLL